MSNEETFRHISAEEFSRLDFSTVISSLEELVDSAKAHGVRIVACQMSNQT